MADPDRIAALSEEERRIAGLLADGLNPSEIAKRLALPYRTVADSAKTIRQQLGVSDLEALRKLIGTSPR